MTEHTILFHASGSLLKSYSYSKTFSNKENITPSTQSVFFHRERGYKREVMSLSDTLSKVISPANQPTREQGIKVKVKRKNALHLSVRKMAGGM